MIRQHVVLVLGAGASKPYGYPLGIDLRSNLIAPSQTLLDLVIGTGHDQGSIDDFCREFSQSNLASIDVFLERRQEMAALGRAMIAAVILKCDETGSLRGDWYEYLFKSIENHLDNNPYKVMFASGDWTCTIARWKGRMIGPLRGLDGEMHPATNKSFDLEFCTVARWKDGEIVEENLFYDQVGFLKQIGVL